WEQQWQNERKRLNDEVDRLKALLSADEKRKAARQALLQRLGKLQGSVMAAEKTADEWERELQGAKAQWVTEREQLKTDIERLDVQLRRAQAVASADLIQEIRAEYEHQLAEAHYERQRLEQDIQFVTGELASERQRLNARIEALEAALPIAQETSRRQT